MEELGGMVDEQLIEGYLGADFGDLLADDLIEELFSRALLNHLQAHIDVEEKVRVFLLVFLIRELLLKDLLVLFFESFGLFNVCFNLLADEQLKCLRGD